MARVVSSSRCAWMPGSASRRSAAPKWPQAIPADRSPSCTWATAIRGNKQSLATWLIARSMGHAGGLGWIVAGHRLQPASKVPWGLARRADAAARSLIPSNPRIWFGPYLFAPWVLSHVRDAETTSLSNRASIPQASMDWLPWGLSRAEGHADWLPWGMGIRIDQGVIIITPPPDPDEPDPSTVIIPTRRVYIVINDASLTRVSNSLALPASSISVAIDDGRAHWSWSATLPLASLANLEPDTPGQLVELQADINGAVFRLLVESIRERESFGSAALSIGGRGLSAEIASPAYPLVTHSNAGGAANAQQLANEALTINGVPLGWDLEWQTADWLVPAGAWAMTGSPMDAIVRISAAAGGYVQAAPASRTLRVLPRYPIAPWDWASAVPDFILPASAVLERGVEHLNGAPCNVVFVSGRGFGARVKRTGSSADTAASMIVDPLISDTAPAAAKGLEVLGATGARRRLSIETGILPGIGVMHVGAMLDWVRGTSSIRGLVRSVSVSASMSSAKSRDPLVVRQSLEIDANA